MHRFQVFLSNIHSNWHHFMMSLRHFHLITVIVKRRDTYTQEMALSHYIHTDPLNNTLLFKIFLKWYMIYSIPTQSPLTSNSYIIFFSIDRLKSLVKFVCSKFNSQYFNDVYNFSLERNGIMGARRRKNAEKLELSQKSIVVNLCNRINGEMKCHGTSTKSV